LTLPSALSNTTRWRGIVYRAHHPKWAYDPLSGEGAKRYGGRFNRPGIPALYTALTPECAWAEAQQGFAFKAQPMTLCAYRVDCEDILDLRTDSAYASVGASFADLACAWEDLAALKQEVPSWALQTGLCAKSVAAILVPSFAPAAPAGAYNMVFWKWSEDLPHSVKVVDDFGRLSL
jgi:RES domain-containing protein